MEVERIAFCNRVHNEFPLVSAAAHKRVESALERMAPAYRTLRCTLRISTVPRPVPGSFAPGPPNTMTTLEIIEKSGLCGPKASVSPT
jgi:hypothetical protein